MSVNIKNGIYIVIVVSTLIGCNSGSNSYPKRENGDLDQSFKQDKAEKAALEKEKRVKDSLIAEGWQETFVKNGPMPSCFNFKPKQAKSIDNYLDINVGGGTDVVVKLMNYETEKTIRYVFVNSNTSYRIKHIPEGKYYLKIAYGKNWISKVENGQCIGRFLSGAIYEKGEDLLDYRFIHNSDGYQIPSFSLSLDVIASEKSNSFESQNISENDFNQ